MALLASMGGMAFWKWRAHIRLVRRGAVVAIIVLAMVMNAPVWYLFDRLSNITGGTGWWRSFLIDQTISHFDEWWLFGTTYTLHWAPVGEVIAADPNMMDITNHYVIQCVSGGLLKLLLFLAIIVVSFKTMGRWLKFEGVGSSAGILVWGAGVSLFAHSLSFVSTTYFDQIVVIWYWLLAVIACIPVWKSDMTGDMADSDLLSETIEKGENQNVADGENVPAMVFLNGTCNFKLGAVKCLNGFVPFLSSYGEDVKSWFLGYRSGYSMGHHPITIDIT
jgi:hypothetical protein